MAHQSSKATTSNTPVANTTSVIRLAIVSPESQPIATTITPTTTKTTISSTTATIQTQNQPLKNSTPAIELIEINQSNHQPNSNGYGNGNDNANYKTDPIDIDSDDSTIAAETSKMIESDADCSRTILVDTKALNRQKELDERYGG